MLDGIRKELNTQYSQILGKNRDDVAYQLLAAGVHFSGHHHLWTAEVRHLFYRWLDYYNFFVKRDHLFSGAKLNVSENQAALHTKLRDLSYQSLFVDGVDVAKQIKASHARLAELSDAIRKGRFQAKSGCPITDVVHIGMGGSVFGPQLCYDALLKYRDSSIRVHFISFMDLTLMQDLLRILRPENTLFVLASKSFTTEENIFQASVAKEWLVSSGLNSDNHFIAVTANADGARQWGIPDKMILPIWSWVGGRFSLWSSISFVLAIAIGMDAFYQLLQGAHGMDCHFREAAYDKNIPIQMACLSAWYTDIGQLTNHAITPYSAKFQMLPLYLQQLQMESLGKSITLDGQDQPYLATPVVFGDIGTRSQHSLSQYLMQAPIQTPVDIISILAVENDSENRLNAHAKAQSDVLWHGHEDRENSFKRIVGQRPHTVIALDELTPATLGALLAMYEHKVFVLSVLYHINAFDQWGVERGKVIANQHYQQPYNSVFSDRQIDT